MALLPTVGRRQPGARAMVAAIYAVLVIGGVSMVIPFMITLTCSVSNRYDLEKYHAIPTYVWDDDELYCKFLFEKYTEFADLRRINNLVHLTTEREMRMAGNVVEDFFPVADRYRRGIDRPRIAAIREDYESFLESYPSERTTRCFGELALERFRDWLKARYLALAEAEGLLTATDQPVEVALKLMNQMNGEVVATEFALADEPPGMGRGPKAFLEDTQLARDYTAFVAELEPSWKQPEFLDQAYESFTRTKYVTVGKLNEAWGTAYEDFIQVRYPIADPEHPVMLADKRDFLANEFPLRLITVPESYAGRFRDWLLAKLGSLHKINLELFTDCESVDQIPFTATYSGTRPYRRYWSDFVLTTVPVEDRRFSGFEIDYADYLRRKYGTPEALSAAYAVPVADFESFRVPFDWLDYDEFYRDRGSWRRFFLTHNFSTVLRFLAVRSRAIWNTIVLVALTVAAGLTINPIAAYALSRFNLRNTQQILIFLLIPMSFPPEVSMIPSFLLLRSFPLGLLLCGGGAGIGSYLLFRRLFPAWNRGWHGAALIAVAFLIGRFAALPLCNLLAIPPSITLLNTYAALVLPGMAAGFSIFLLKGFFDGLPRELYEAASIDGASELKMFRIITYPLCKPIIVVTLMGQVLAAYGGFMWAFVVCQEKSMWTLMVWLYAFQSEYAEGQLNLIMAALTLASIPTFIFFIFCQKIILRGIILPSMK